METGKFVPLDINLQIPTVSSRVVGIPSEGEIQCGVAKSKQLDIDKNTNKTDPMVNESWADRLGY